MVPRAPVLLHETIFRLPESIFSDNICSQLGLFPRSSGGLPSNFTICERRQRVF